LFNPFSWLHAGQFLQEFSVILGNLKATLALFFMEKWTRNRLSARGRTAKVALLGQKSSSDEGQMYCSRNASVGLLTGKSATLAIQNLSFTIVLACKSLESSDLQKDSPERDFWRLAPISSRRRDSGGGYFR